MYRILGGIIGILSGFIVYLLVFHFTPPATSIGDTHIPFVPRKALEKELVRTSDQPFQIYVQDRVYEYSYIDLGIIQDDSSLDQLFGDQSTSLLARAPIVIKQFFSENQFDAPLVFTEDYYSFIESTIFDFSEKAEIEVDTVHDQLVYNPQEKYRIDGQALKDDIRRSFIQKRPIQAKLVPLDSVLGASVEAFNARLTRALNTPISLLVNSTGNTTLILSPQDIRSFVTIDHEFAEDSYQVTVNETEFAKIMSSRNVRMGDAGIDIDELRSKVTDLIKQRMDGLPTDVILVDMKVLPNTDGTHADKYIEVDISQQKMYLFEHGELVATHGISSGLYYPTPRGEFKIMNKAKNAYSDIYHVYMPYWMAFYYGSDVQAYFGIHELPYWVSADGSKHQRPREFIGQPKTGGCVALDVGAAQEVYNFSDIGTPLLIFE